MKSIILICGLMFAMAAEAAIVDVNSLNKILSSQNVGWIAKTNPVNELQVTDVKRMLGVAGEQDEAVDFALPKAKTRLLLPLKVDWRDNNGNWVSPVLDQANCGSCVAFATIATLETQYKIASGFSAFNIKLSPQHLFSCGGGWCDFGWQPDNAATYLQTHGVPDESCMPYISGATGQDVACTAACPDATRRSVKIASFSSPTRQAADLDSLRVALQKGPLVTTLGVYADFVGYSSGVYKHVTGERLGGHAVSIVGYDDTLRAFIIRNSWGTSWGEAGFAHVSYDDISGIGTATWSFVMPSMNGGVTVEGPLDYTYASGSLDLKAHSTYQGTDSMTVSFFDGSGKAVWSATCAGGNCEQPVEVSAIADGRYEVQAIAMDHAGQTLGQSTRQFFYIANQKPTLGLSFTGANGTDLGKGLKNRMEVAITATSSSVPMSSVEFHYRGVDGIDNVRTASVVVNGMTMGWRTNLSPNGSYEIWMAGHVKTNSTDTVITTPHQTVTVAN